MKNIFAVIIVVFISSFGYSQGNLGFKAGPTFPVGEGIVRAVNDAYQNGSDQAIGYNIGAFYRIDLIGFFVQPELIYTTYKNKYDAGVTDKSFDVNYRRIDVPVQIGKSFLGLGRIYTGPVFSYYLEDDFSLGNVSDIDQENISVGLSIGAGATIKKISIDARYEFPFTDRQTDFLFDGSKFQTEDTPKLLQVSFGYKF